MPRTLVRFVLLALLASALVSVVALSLVGREPEAFQAAAGGKFVNPIYSRLLAIGEREGFDVSFTREVVNQRNVSTIDHPMFSMPEHGVDVLIFGDSTAAWGITPQVIEAVSGLRVAMFAVEGMPLNEALCTTFFRALIDKYLAPDGRTLFYFSPGNILRDPQNGKLFLRRKHRPFAQRATHDQTVAPCGDLQREASLHLGVIKSVFGGELGGNRWKNSAPHCTLHLIYYRYMTQSDDDCQPGPDMRGIYLR